MFWGNDQKDNIEETRAGLELDLKEQKISIAGATGLRVCGLIRKRTLGGALGRVYFLEKRKSGSTHSGEIFLYGGRIEYTTEENFDDPNPRAALARELNEEVLDEFSGGHFNEFASIYGKAENGKMVALDIYTLQDAKARKLSVDAIKDFQASQAKKLKKKKKELKEKTSAGASAETLEEIEADIKKLQECVEAGPPVKIRDFRGLWLQFWPPTINWPFVNWRRLSPYVAYALLMDRRQRRS